MANSFPYEPLIGSEIRLVSVKVESPKDEIHCKIETVPLDEHLKYYALSYVWGDPQDRLAITLEDRNFAVTKNLFGFLGQLLEWVKNGDFDDEVGIGGPVGFWIDAICIDQSNPEEKSKQVPRMKDIYSSAVRVYGWLGVPAPLDDQLVKMVFEKANQIAADPRARDIKWIQNYPLVSDLGQSYAAFTEAFLSIIQRPWFSRIWIIQEAVLARTEPLFVIGPHFTNALSILSIIYMSALKKSGDPREEVTLQRNLGPIKLQRLRGYYQSLDAISTSLSSQGVSELAIFAKRLNRIMRDTTLNYKSTLGHDMIFALLGMASSPSILPQSLIPNYEAPFHDICHAYVKFLIENTLDLTILSKMDCEFDPNTTGIPTWIQTCDSPAARSQSPVARQK